MCVIGIEVRALGMGETLASGECWKCQQDVRQVHCYFMQRINTARMSDQLAAVSLADGTCLQPLACWLPPCKILEHAHDSCLHSICECRSGTLKSLQLVATSAVTQT